jgi:hypothetical protein
MPVDASIPLSTAQYQAPDVLGNAEKTLEIKDTQQQLQMRQQALEAQKAEAEAFKGADFSTPEGRNAALVKIMQTSPQVGLGLMKEFTDIDKSQAQTKQYLSKASAEDLKTAQDKRKIVTDAALPAWNAYQTALHQGKPEQVARAEADKLMPQAIADLQNSGMFTDQEMQSMPRVFDPARVGGALIATGMQSKMIEDHLKEAQTNAADAEAKLHTDEQQNPEKYHPKKETGSQLVQGADGKYYSIDPNHPERGTTGVPGSEGMHKPGTAGSAAANKPNIRAATVAAATNNSKQLISRIEQNYGDSANTSMIFKDDPKSPMGVGIQAIEKKFIPNKTLKLDADARALVDEAGPAFTGGLRVNSSFREFLMNQLPSPGDPPEVSKEKWDVFKANINGASNTFQKAYSGNPDYWAKDQSGKIVDPNSDPNFFKGGTQEQAPAQGGSGKQQSSKQVSVNGQNMTAQLAPDGKYYVKKDGKYFEVQE